MVPFTNWGNVPEQMLPMPARHSGQSPQGHIHALATWSPTLTLVTPGPTSMTTPDASCPATMGSCILVKPLELLRSLWQ